VVVLREHATVCGDAGVARPRHSGTTTSGSLGLLLRVEESPSCSPSPLHRVLVPGFMEVRLNKGMDVMLGACAR
jgi:hypothetical protein